MKTATKPNAKRIACVGEDDPTYVAQIVRGLEQLGMTARHMSAFSLRLAPRPPDLTVLLGSAVKDGGAEVVDQLGKNRGPFAVVMGPGGLAAPGKVVRSPGGRGRGGGRSGGAGVLRHATGSGLLTVSA